MQIDLLYCCASLPEYTSYNGKYRNTVEHYMNRMYIEVPELYVFLPGALRLLRWVFHYISASYQHFMNLQATTQPNHATFLWIPTLFLKRCLKWLFSGITNMAAYYWPALKRLNSSKIFVIYSKFLSCRGFRRRNKIMLSGSSARAVLERYFSLLAVWGLKLLFALVHVSNYCETVPYLVSISFLNLCQLITHDSPSAGIQAG